MKITYRQLNKSSLYIDMYNKLTYTKCPFLPITAPQVTKFILHQHNVFTQTNILLICMNWLYLLMVWWRSKLELVLFLY